MLGRESRATGRTDGLKQEEQQVCEKQPEEGKGTCSGCEHTGQLPEGKGQMSDLDPKGSLWLMESGWG